MREIRSAAATRNMTVVRMLWGNGQGNFQTKGRYAAAMGARHGLRVFDRCDGTLVKVRDGTVTVTDLARHKTIIVVGGKSFLVTKPWPGSALAVERFPARAELAADECQAGPDLRRAHAHELAAKDETGT
jgi:hypothetical protein